MGQTKLSKAVFFHHFKNKAALAKAVLDHWADNDDSHVIEFANRARNLAEDPFHEAMIFIKLFEEWLMALDAPTGGCMLASFSYESAQFDPSMQDYIKERLLVWMGLYRGIFERLVAFRKSQSPDVDGQSLTEMLATIFEGGLLLARALNDKTYLVRQLQHFRQYLTLLFNS